MFTKLPVLCAAFLTSFLLHAGYTGPANAQKLQLVFEQPAFIRQGRDLIQEGKAADAKKVYHDALKRSLTDNQSAQAHNGLCVAYFMTETWETALKHCNLAIQLVPHNWRYHNNRGNIFLETGAFGKAIKAYERAIAISPASQIARDNLDLALNQKQALLDASRR